MLWTQLMLADPSFGQDVPKPMVHKLETDLGAHRRDRATSHSCEDFEGSRDNAARVRRHDFAVSSAGERAGGRAGEERLGSAPVCRTVRVELWCKDLFPGSPSRLREIQRMERRGAQGAEAAWCSNAIREGRGHTRQVFAHPRSRRLAIFWFCWRCGFYTAKCVQGLSGLCLGTVQSRGGCSRMSRRTGTRRMEVGCRSLAGVSARGVRGLGPGRDGGWDWCAMRTVKCEMVIRAFFCDTRRRCEGPQFHSL